MRVALLLLCVSATVAANPRNPETPRPDLKAMRATVWVMKDGKLVEDGRSVFTYDATGHLVRTERRKGGKVKVSTEATWDAAGRMTSSTYRDDTGRKEIRTLTYKLDANGRIVERTLRDPSKPAGELIRYEYRWEPDGSHAEQAFRHFAKEGPYKSDYELYDAKGRTTRNCHEHGGCSMIEYDAHGEISRIRQHPRRDPGDRLREDHYYLVYENTYDQAGHLVTQILGGTQTDFTWNARNEITEVVTRRIAAQGGAIESKTVYTYDYR